MWLVASGGEAVCALCRYKVVIQTSAASGAGTQAQSSMRMVFKTAVIEHDVHADPDDLARGGEAHVVVKCLEHGSIQELWLGHSNEGASPPDWRWQLLMPALHWMPQGSATVKASCSRIAAVIHEQGKLRVPLDRLGATLAVMLALWACGLSLTPA